MARRTLTPAPAGKPSTGTATPVATQYATHPRDRRAANRANEHETCRGQQQQRHGCGDAVQYGVPTETVGKAQDS
jgi:hypothetical protein